MNAADYFEDVWNLSILTAKKIECVCDRGQAWPNNRRRKNPTTRDSHASQDDHVSVFYVESICLRATTERNEGPAAKGSRSPPNRDQGSASRAVTNLIRMDELKEIP